MDIRVLVVAYDSGRYRARMGCGPDRLFDTCMEPLLARLGHRVTREEIVVSDSHPAEIASAFALCRAVAGRVRACRDDGHFPLVLSGNCGIAVGAVSGCGCRNTGVVWFDAHGEATTPDTTTSGFLDGMGIGILTGQCWRGLALSIPGFEPVPGNRILLVGARDMEAAELELLDREGVVRRPQPGTWSRKSPRSPGSRMACTCISIWMCWTPARLMANQWAPPGGLTVEALKRAVQSIQRQTKIKGFGIASYDPEADRDGRALGAAKSRDGVAAGGSILSTEATAPSRSRLRTVKQLRRSRDREGAVALRGRRVTYTSPSRWPIFSFLVRR